MYRPYGLFQYDHDATRDFTIIAHRGASAYFPENTLSAFRGAMAMQADMIELDVQLTSDGEVVVFHDEKIHRCTRSRGRISDYTLAQLKRLDAGSWFSRDFAEEKIPTLEEVVNLCKDRMAINIEIKTEAVADAARGGIEEKCLRIVHQAGMQDHVVFSSFDPRALWHLREIQSATGIATLYEKKHYGLQMPSQILRSLGADAFNCSVRELSAARLADLREHAIPFNVYTVDDEKKMKRLIDLGAGGIFTNKPDVLRKVLMAFTWTQGNRKH